LQFKSEKKIKKHLRRSIYSLKEIPLGKEISKDNLILFRPVSNKKYTWKKNKEKIASGSLIKK